jgi:hypothetical protein
MPALKWTGRSGPLRFSAVAIRAGLSAMLLLPLVSLPAAAAGGAEIGQVKTASGQTFIVRGGVSTPAKVGDLVQEKDTIETGADGAIGITFIDNTVFSAGPNSQVAMEEYAFDSSNFKGAMTADVNRGTLSVVSGDIARSTPGAMKIKTPTAILGVRGTIFAVQVGGGK